MVTASLHNLGHDTVVVGAEALTLVDQNGHRYLPVEGLGHDRPSLVGARLESGGWVLGQVLFDVPEETVGKWLEWCAEGAGNCQTHLAPLSL